MKLKTQLESIMSDEANVETVMNVAAGVIVKFEQDRPYVLLIQRAADDHWPLHWEFPRGKCDKPVGEDLIHCLKREVKEDILQAKDNYLFSLAFTPILTLFTFLFYEYGGFLFYLSAFTTLFYGTLAIYNFIKL